MKLMLINDEIHNHGWKISKIGMIGIYAFMILTLYVHHVVILILHLSFCPIITTRNTYCFI